MSSVADLLAREIARAASLARATHLAANLGNPDTALRDICEEVRTILGTSAVAVNLLDVAGQHFTWTAQIGIPESLTSSKQIPRDLFEEYAVRFQPVFSETRPEVLQADPFLAAFVERGLQAFACAPILQRGNLLGVLSAACYGCTRPPFSPAEEQWLLAMANTVVHAAVAKRTVPPHAGDGYQEILSAMCNGILFVDSELRTEFVNEQLAAMLGYGVEEMLGRPALHFVPEQERASALEHFEQRRRGVSQRHEFPMARKDGTELRVTVFSSPIRDISGTFRGALAVLVDSAAQRALSAQLHNAEKVRSLGVLAAGIAHDFNNLLAAILGNAALAEESVPHGSEAAAALRDICSAALSATELTSKMLAYSGKRRLLVQKADINRLVQDSLPQIYDMTTHLIRVELGLAPDLPLIMADAEQLQFVLLSLVANAIEALPSEGGCVRIITNTQSFDRRHLQSAYLNEGLPEGKYVVLSICDTGRGMPPEVRERIFDPFFSTKFAGRGLSLSAVLGILQGHGAGIQVQSEESCGSSFAVLFPVAVTANATRKNMPVQAIKGMHGQGLVLVVDDETLVRSAVRRVLESAGYQVLCASDGREAVDMFAQRPLDFVAVVLDLTMPRLSGKEALQELRLARHDIPVVLTSGYAERDILELRDTPASCVLPKPWQPADLLNAVASAVEGSDVPAEPSKPNV